MNERTEPVPDNGPGTSRPAYRGPFRQPGLGTRIEEYERRGTEDFFAGEYRPRPAMVMCAVCKVSPEHCLCAADPDALRYALAQISVIHSPRDGVCSRCGTQIMLCGYLALLRHARNHRAWTPPPDGAHPPGGV
jgi:hypothetical protein